MTKARSISPPHREPNGRISRTKKADLTAVEAAEQLDEIRRLESRRIMNVAVNNPSRRGEDRALMGGIGEAVAAYEAAFTLMQRLVNVGGEIEASELYYAGTRYLNLWTDWRRAKGLPVGHIIAGGSDAVEDDERANQLWSKIARAESAVRTVSVKAQWIVRHICADAGLKADMRELSPNDTVALVLGLRLLHEHFTENS